MKKIVILAIVVGVIFLGLVAAGFYIYSNSFKENGNLSENRPIGGQEDDQGCLESAGYSWCEAKQKCLRIFEEFCPDKVANLVAEIETNSGVKLVNQGDSQFNWIVNYTEDKTTDYEVTGVLYEATGVKLADYLNIENYLNDIAEANSYNLADGVVGGLRGYYYQYMVCDLNFRHQEMRENEEGLAEPVGDNLNVKLECGYFNHNDIPDIALQEAMRELFREKYGLPPAKMKINLEQKAENHIRGSVTFLDDEFNPVSGGYFFAQKTDQGWQLVLDGNGQISCTVLRERNFPQEMMNDCVED